MSGVPSVPLIDFPFVLEALISFRIAHGEHKGALMVTVNGAQPITSSVVKKAGVLGCCAQASKPHVMKAKKNTTKITFISISVSCNKNGKKCVTVCDKNGNVLVKVFNHLIVEINFLNGLSR